ncbi:MAG TPA: HIG1 domain-containing protein [Burkholderiales bacterium]|nr:HIG1 domain-containing protein [Burkholderiales bacterium]
MTALVFAAAFGVVVALVAGIAAMMSDGPVSNRRSESWMSLRIAAQAAALLFILLGLATTPFL